MWYGSLNYSHRTPCFQPFGTTLAGMMSEPIMARSPVSVNSTIHISKILFAPGARKTIGKTRGKSIGKTIGKTIGKLLV